jgi:predicted acylesterase/phospholipase RssA
MNAAGATGASAGFDAAVFAGGGCRCFWQAGFWSTAAPALGLDPRRVAAVSAGAAFACAVFGGAIEAVLEDFVRRTRANARNVYPRNAWRREPVFPHERMYRATILANLDAPTLARLRAGPEIRVAVARPPARLGAGAAYAAALVAYQLDRASGSGAHPVWARRLGFRSEWARVGDCASPAELAELILHSSCTPPVTPLYRRGGRPVFDGGLVDNAPVDGVAGAERVLVLLTRPYADARLPRAPGRVYARPSRELPIHKWDYTSPGRVQETFDLGCRDGEAFSRRMASGNRSAA